MKTFKIVATINTPVETCWNAWTNVQIAKKWLGTTHCGTKPGHDYRISTPIPYLSGRHQISEITPNQNLKLNYSLDGWPAEVVVQFDEEENKTKLTIDFSIDTTAAPEHIEPLSTSGKLFYFIRGSWNHAIFRLRSLLEDQNLGVFIDNKNNDHEINLSIDIKSTPEKLYNALLDVKQMQQWAGSDFVLDESIIDPKVDGIYSYAWYPKDTPEQDLQDGPSKILQLEPNKLLVHNWHGGQKIAEISWLLEDIGNGITRLKFKHSPILGHTHGNVWSYRSGWSEGLYDLKWYAERGELNNYWITSK
ncbi:MAG: SRPBCC family protein [Akkermansiaceae bacterium]